MPSSTVEVLPADTEVLRESTTSRAKHWVFTLNNYTEEEVNALVSLGNSGIDCTYLIYGRETGDSGTPHLQGFISFPERTRFATAKS